MRKKNNPTKGIRTAIPKVKAFGQEEKVTRPSLPDVPFPPLKSKAEQFVEKTMEYKAFKYNYKNECKRLRYEASKEFRNKNHVWIKTLDIIGVILILLNFGALFMTGVLVVKNEPDKGFSEANPAQCAWNGWSCHTDYKDVIIPILKQMVFWAILVFLYIYTRNNTFNITGMWILTGLMTFYAVALTTDFVNDLGLYIGKILFGI